MITRKLFAATLLLMLPCTAIVSQSFAQESRSARIDGLFAALDQMQAPGAAVVVVRDGIVIHRKAYGLANIELSVPNKPETVFRLASVTKQFTAMAILQLYDRGKLRLEDPLSAFLPDLPGAEQITIQHLLTHTAGVPDFISIEEAKKTPLEFSPGDRLNYSNTGYEILGRIIEQVSGQSYEAFLEAGIFQPLKMAHTGLYSKERITMGLAAGYQPDGKGGLRNADRSDTGKPGAAGGLYSNVDDMLLWDRALYTGVLARPQTVALAFTPATLNGGRKVPYACGWMVGEHRGLREVGHGGDITGYNTYIARYPEQRCTVIVLSNMTMRPPGPIPTAADLAHRIAEIVLSDKMDPVKPSADVQVNPSILEAYVGRYQLMAPRIILENSGEFFAVTLEGGRLFAQSGPMKVPLFAESETTFYSKLAPAKMTFTRNNAGEVTGFILTLAGVREYRAVRTE